MIYLMQNGEIKGTYAKPEDAWEALLAHHGGKSVHKAVTEDGWEAIDEDMFQARRTAWLEYHGFGEEEVLEDEEGEFVLEEVENYAHPSDEGASVDTVKTYLNYAVIE